MICCFFSNENFPNTHTEYLTIGCVEIKVTWSYAYFTNVWMKTQRANKTCEVTQWQSRSQNPVLTMLLFRG